MTSRSLELRDLSDPADGPHAMQVLLDDVLAALTSAWDCALDVQRRRPLVSVEDNYDRLGYAVADITRDARYSRYAAETVILRSHTSAGVPPALRALAAARAADPEVDVLLALPGPCYHRDSIDRLHVATPRQVDLWRVTTRRLRADDLQRMVALVVGAVLPGVRWRPSPAHHPYTTQGPQVDVCTASGWVELAKCGLAAEHVLTGAGLDADRYSGVLAGTVYADLRTPPAAGSGCARTRSTCPCGWYCVPCRGP